MTSAYEVLISTRLPIPPFCFIADRSDVQVFKSYPTATSVTYS